MKKQLLPLAMLFSVLTTFAVTPYTFFPYKADLGASGWLQGTAYTVPDAAITAYESLRPISGSGTPANTSYAMGVRADYFDQATNSQASTYVSEYKKTFGHTYGVGDATAGTNIIRSWVISTATDSSDYNPVITSFVGYNANPGAFRYGGGWYCYTVSFTEAGRYEFLLRTRWTSPTTDNTKRVEVYNKSDISTAIATLNFNNLGLDCAAEGNMSTDAKVKYLFSAKIVPGTPTQAVSIWTAIADKINIPAAGDYVIKITDVSAGVANSSIGGFALLKTTASAVNEISINPTLVSTTVSSELQINQLTNGSTISIQSFDGRIISSTNAKSESISIDMNSFSKGIYLVKIATLGSKVSTFKILKQ